MPGGEGAAVGPRADVPGLYARLLGEAWAALPEPIRRLHQLDDRLVATGRARVERGGGLASRLIGALTGLPPAAEDVAVRVEFRRRGEREIWRRDFGGRTLVTPQGPGRDGLLVERFGPVSFEMTPAWDGQRLGLTLRRWRLFGLSMPAALGPRMTAWEAVVEGRFAFFVEMGHPAVGLLVRYRGWLTPV
ncbi:MAG: DUF4166 domain-containing protein [Pseudomonadota bacterium]